MLQLLRLLRILMWTALWACALVGLATIAAIIFFLIEHRIYCNPPRGQWAVECMATEDAVPFLAGFVPLWLLPLVGALLIRAVLRRVRPHA